MAVSTFEASVVGINKLTPSVRQFDFQRVDGEPVTFRPGQFVMVHFDVGGEEQTRSYSFCNMAAKGEAMSFAAAPVDGGMGTGYLWSLNEGDTCTFSGPYGRFLLRPKETPDRLILVATGTGVSPYRAMLPELVAAAKQGRQIEILLGVRTREELLFGDDFLAAAEENDTIHFHPCYSRADGLEPYERRGYVHEALTGLDVDAERDIVYLCGNPNMVDQAIDFLETSGFGPRRVRREKYT